MKGVAAVCRLVGVIVLVVAFSLAAIAKDVDETYTMTRAYTPADCISLLRALPNNGLMDWRDLVEVEHCDRIQRLSRLTSETFSSRVDGVEFFDGEILASELPADVDVKIPLLRVVFPDKVFFDTDSANLRAEAEVIVEVIANSMQAEPPDVALFVIGHADARGANVYNLNLSIDRANTLAEAILNKGINAASIWRMGMGEDLPLVAGNDEYAWGRNRRVEFLFAARPEAAATWVAKFSLDLSCKGRSLNETQKCRKSLNLKPAYEALELTQSKLGVSLETYGEDLSLTGQGVSIHPITQRQQVQLRSPRRIRIDLTQRVAKAVELVSPNITTNTSLRRKN